MTTDTKTALTIASVALLALHAPLEGGKFKGITTLANGTHVAVVLLGVAPRDKRYNYDATKAYAESVGGQRAPKAVLSLLFATNNGDIPEDWYFADEPQGASYAWYCTFDGGHIDCGSRSSEGAAVAVRLIPLTA